MRKNMTDLDLGDYFRGEKHWTDLDFCDYLIAENDHLITK